MKSDAKQSKRGPNWLELPPEVTSIIIQKIGAVDILKNAQRVCKSWHAICLDPSMWRSIDLKFFPRWDFLLDFGNLARHAVDRSCGQLVDITLTYLATDGLIRHLAENCGQLRRLKILSCQYLTADVLTETASKFPMLEEFNVQSSPISVEAVEAIGKGCPKLKIFKCDRLGHLPRQAKGDEIAEIIAHAMPQLCHLQFLSADITNTGLKAILNGCPSLETLDIRGCYLVDPKVDNLEAACSVRFKEVRFPTEPIFDELEDVEHDCYSDDESDSFFEQYGSDFEFPDHFDAPSDFDDMFYDDDGVDYDDIFDFEDGIEVEEEGDHGEELEFEEGEEEVAMMIEDEEEEARIKEEEEEARIKEEEEEARIEAEEEEAKRIEEEEEEERRIEEEEEEARRIVEEEEEASIEEEEEETSVK